MSLPSGNDRLTTDGIHFMTGSQNGKSYMVKGTKLSSPDKRFNFVYQDDSNLVLYGPDGVVWASNTDRADSDFLYFYGTGNLAIVKDNGDIVWQSNSYVGDSTGVRIEVLNTGIVQITGQTDKSVYWRIGKITAPEDSTDTVFPGTNIPLDETHVLSSYWIYKNKKTPDSHIINNYPNESPEELSRRTVTTPGMPYGFTTNGDLRRGNMQMYKQPLLNSEYHLYVLWYNAPLGEGAPVPDIKRGVPTSQVLPEPVRPNTDDVLASNVSEITGLESISNNLVLYKDFNFGGDKLGIDDSSENQNLPGDWNNIVSSFRMKPGYQVVFHTDIYGDGFAKKYINDTDRNMDIVSFDINWNDSITSYSLSSIVPAVPDARVRLYPEDRIGYTDYSIGDYNVSNFDSYKVQPNSLVRFYTDVNQENHAFKVWTGTDESAFFLPPSEFRGKIKSIKVIDATEFNKYRIYPRQTYIDNDYDVDISQLLIIDENTKFIGFQSPTITGEHIIVSRNTGLESLGSLSYKLSSFKLSPGTKVNFYGYDKEAEFINETDKMKDYVLSDEFNNQFGVYAINYNGPPPGPDFGRPDTGPSINIPGVDIPLPRGISADSPDVPDRPDKPIGDEVPINLPMVSYMAIVGGLVGFLIYY